MATFVCDTCDYSKSAPDEWVNRRAICPKCKQRSVIQPDDLPLTLSAEFDEAMTYAYKGDFLGTTLSDFLHRHDDMSGSDFRLALSADVPDNTLESYDFEDWMRHTDRLVQYGATGDRLTIVGFPLQSGVYTFLDSYLASITLTLKDQSLDTWADLLPELMLALNDDTEDTPPLDNINITTWVRPLGNLNLVYIEDPSSVQVRYVNLETLDQFNQLRTSITASDDL
ncbi:MAG: hypothetical protein GXP28_08605 [Planctomycetes bacterium]|nr:hypothetical protein [Planctomycetota bacterium]